jgi:hypothetical protein
MYSFSLSKKEVNLNEAIKKSNPQQKGAINHAHLFVVGSRD